MILRKTTCNYIYGFLSIAFGNAFAYGQSTTASEYELKAVFIFNFTQFVQWPATSFSSEHAPLVIGILGEDPFGPYLNDVISGEKVDGHPLVIEHYATAGDIKNCHILFVSKNEITRFGQLAATLKKQNVLTVGDAPTFLMQEGMIKLLTKNNKIQLQINIESVKESNLVISSKLLRLAEIYTPDKK